MLIYYFDENNIFTHTDIIEDGGTLPQNATTVAPVDSNGAVARRHANMVWCD